eukprot:scaffold5772_cov55-Cyclotella_meneghiniana.AAC.2
MYVLRVRCDSRTFRAYSNLKPKENPSRGPPDLKVSPRQQSIRTFKFKIKYGCIPLSRRKACLFVAEIGRKGLFVNVRMWLIHTLDRRHKQHNATNL